MIALAKFVSLISDSTYSNPYSLSPLQGYGDFCEEISGRKLTWSYEETNHVGDHIWWISDVRKFQKQFPRWKFRYRLQEILEEIHRAVADRGTTAIQLSSVARLRHTIVFVLLGFVFS